MEFRPRLPDTEDWKYLIDLSRELGAKEAIARVHRTLNNSKEQVTFGEDDDSYVLYSESERIKTMEALLEAADVDMDRFEVKRKIVNKWDQHSVEKGMVELFQIKVWLEPKYLAKPDAKYYNKWLDSVKKMVGPIDYGEHKSIEPIVLVLADLHVGSFIENERLVPDYNIEEIRSRLDKIARTANSYDRPVHVKLLGDLIESFTGKNHKNTWKQIEQHGMEVALTAFDLLSEFIQKLDKFCDLDIIAGNHDRISSSNQDDTYGQVAMLVQGMFDRISEYKDTSRWHHRILTAVHDDICYIMTHGHKKITKKEPAQLIMEYGEQKLFNVLINAHGHEEKIHDSSVKYQSIQVPSIVVPNEFALDLGSSSPSGFAILERSPIAEGVNKHIYSL